MGGPTPLSKEELSKTLAQEISQRGDQIPQKYIYKEGFPDAIDAPDHQLWRDTLLIDFSLLSSSSDHHQLAKLNSALSNWGCFQEKLKCVTKDDVYHGYGNDTVYAGNQNVGWNDRLYLTLYPEEIRKLELWPQKPYKFRELADEYSKRVAILSQDIYKAMARCLDLEEDCFLKHIGKQTIRGRFGMYPRCPHPDRVLGVRPHSDGVMMAVLLAEKEVEGLQIQKDDQWYKVPIIPGALFINLGDFGEVMTNGIFKSVIHRVVTNSIKDRVSMVVFCSPEDKNEIGPLNELISPDRPRQYKKFKISEFMQVHFENYASWRRNIDAFKI